MAEQIWASISRTGERRAENHAFELSVAHAVPRSTPSRSHLASCTVGRSRFAPASATGFAIGNVLTWHEGSRAGSQCVKPLELVEGFACATQASTGSEVESFLAVPERCVKTARI